MKNSKSLSPVKAIREHCIDCSGNELKAVRECQITECPLYAYRLGKNPHRQGILQSKAVPFENAFSTNDFKH